MKNLIYDIKVSFFLCLRNLSQKDLISFYYNALNNLNVLITIKSYFDNLHKKT